ncbi:hypothetical protein GCM10023238_20750 [Streptomyces heliomycini]
MSTDVSSTEHEGGTTSYGACAQVLPAEEHLLDMTETRRPGTPVPPERTLAAEFDTSRTTVRQALQELVVEGRLERIRQVHLVASPRSPSAPAHVVHRGHAAQAWSPPRSCWTSATSPPTTARRAARHHGRRAVLRIERLRMANGEPMAIETTHLSAKRFPALRRSLTKYTSSTPPSPRCTTSTSRRPRRP